jgi:hypothetical protein
MDRNGGQDQDGGCDKPCKKSIHGLLLSPVRYPKERRERNGEVGL